MYANLFSPVSIGRLEIKNRVAMTAMGANLAAAGGGVNDDAIAFYEARAKGGVGLIISGVCRVLDGAGASEPNQLAARSTADLQGLERLMDSVHKYGTRLFLQLHHPGREGQLLFGEEPVAASAVPHPLSGLTPRALTVPEIQRIQTAFVTGARIAQMAGADGVELHGAHGYLINSFLSPYLNRRDDDYGGSLENRLRFLLEILAGIREACGRTFPLGVRLSAEEFLGDQGNDLATSCQIAIALEQASIDFLDISCTIPETPPESALACIEPGTYEQGWKKFMAAAIKQHVRIPVIAVANIKEPEVAEAILREGCCDLVGVARGHLADPAWCNQARAGRAEMIRKCIGCLVCLNEIFHHRHVKCSVNPTTGREREFAHPERNGAGRIIAVIGGGPAGLTAVLVLKERGFHPVLFEAARRLGGTLNVADKGVGKDKITRFIDSMVAQARETGIDLRLGEEATVAKVQTLSPSGVFIACGARPFIPPVPGIDGGNVVLAEEVLLHPEEAKGDCVIIGSGMTGLETAEVVLKSGHGTTIVDLLPEIGAGADMMTILDAKQRMAPYQPTYLPGHKLTRITPEGADFECLATGLPVQVAADTVILALGVRPQTDLVARFKAAFPDAHVLGDASRGGRVVDATQDAYGQAFVYEP
ncbi:MAG: NADH:flavin oxidoreductase [Gammaproteobacteria bacterium]|jgi:2,4-dienoyl-CoA reductase-like NADH-dependent reductase (Old Yellow Enzyme family)/thioredoxin reductase|nr:NADH:flavin oxidoreductase [Gammaproteobacteria bacterium]